MPSVVRVIAGPIQRSGKPDGGKRSAGKREKDDTAEHCDGNKRGERYNKAKGQHSACRTAIHAGVDINIKRAGRRH
eukprot:9129125-Heterocapsa_arctica.AAC.1